MTTISVADALAEVGSRVRTLQVERSITDAQMATALRVTPEDLHPLLKGTCDLSVAQLHAFASLAKVSMESLFTGLDAVVPRPLKRHVAVTSHLASLDS